MYICAVLVKIQLYRIWVIYCPIFAFYNKSAKGGKFPWAGEISFNPVSWSGSERSGGMLPLPGDWGWLKSKYNPFVGLARLRYISSFARSGERDIKSTKYYSTLITPRLQPVTKSTEEFLQWFVGFSDGESSFSIVPKKDKEGNIIKFSFVFKISLHKDDYPSLINIQTNLNLGGVSLNKDECKFVASKKEGIYILISIFDKYPLNTSKYLDYLDFKKAFILYYKREGSVTQELKNQILILKNGMNTMRTKEYFNTLNTPLLKHNINKNWLLGLIEGEGSFQLWRNDIVPVFGLVLSERQLPVLEKVKEYLINNLGFDTYSMYKLKSSSAISINYQNARGNSQASVLLLIKNIHILHNYFIPYLDNMRFLTKKYKDFLDFKLICKGIYKGAHKKSEIKSLILKLSLTMNNYRLSTNSCPQNIYFGDRGQAIN